MDEPRVKTCPFCGSDIIGELDPIPTLNNQEYEALGGRYYCLKCGWFEGLEDHDPGCYGHVNEWFTSRREMPKICGDNRCFRMDKCFKISFKNNTGTETDLSYLIKTPKWRTVEE